MPSIDRRRLLALGATGAVAASSTPATAKAAESVSPLRKTSSKHLAASLPGSFSSGHVKTNGVRLHYVAGGKGAPVILLHGWPQTWWEFRKIMPELAKTHRVIAVDLRGGGESSKPESGYDKKTMADDIAGLIAALGYTKAHVVGHDIGAMVAYSLTVNKPEFVDKLVMLDVAHPGEEMYEFRMLPEPGTQFHPWWFAFNQVTSLPEQLVSGRSRFLVDWMFDYLLVNRGAISDADRAIFAQAYATPDAVRGGSAWYKAFGQDITDSGTYGKIATPTLGIACPAFYPGLATALQSQATNLKLEEISETGHYFVDEQPAALLKSLKGFLGESSSSERAGKKRARAHVPG